MESSVVIPAYNAEDTITSLIKACLNQSVRTEVIVVDDGSTDSTADVVKKYPIKYVYQENAGPAKARNSGWSIASGDIICFTDSDCVPEKDWIRKIVSKYISDDVGGVGGSYDIANKGFLLAECIHEEIIQRHLNIPAEADYLGSFNVSYRRRVLEEVGGFNPSFKHASGEDNDLSYRIKKTGYKLIFDADIKVAHYHQTNLLKYLREQYRHGYWRMKLYLLHPEMVKGDNYAGILDFVQPPLAIGFIGVLVACFFYKPLFYVAFLLAVLLLILQIPVTWKVVIRNKRYLYLYLLPVLFLRVFARGFGMVKGVWSFFVLGRIKK